MVKRLKGTSTSADSFQKGRFLKFKHKNKLGLERMIPNNKLTVNT
jgi:hypothetical protein